MCEWILTGLIVGFVNIGPNIYLVQGLDVDGNVLECVMEFSPKENNINF